MISVANPASAACAADVRALRALVPAGQQQHDPRAGLRIVDAIARSRIDPQFPDAVTAESVVAKIALLDAVDPSHDLHLGNRVPHQPQPIQKNVSAVGSQVMANFRHRYFRL